MSTNYYACRVCGCNSYFLRRKKQVCHHCDQINQDTLIMATNTIAKYVAENLPPDWQVVIYCASDECYVELLNPEHEEVEFYTAGESTSKRRAVRHTKS